MINTVLYILRKKTERVYVLQPVFRRFRRSIVNIRIAISKISVETGCGDMNTCEIRAEPNVNLCE